MRSHRRIALFALLLLLGGGWLWGVSPDDQLWERAGMKGELAAERELLEGRFEEERGAGGLPPPVVGVEWGRNRAAPMEQQGAAASSLFFGEVMVGQEFPWPGKRSLSRSIAAEQSRRSRAALQLLELQNGSAIAVRLATLWRLSAEQKLLDSLSHATEEKLRAVERQWASGASRADQAIEVKRELLELERERLALLGDDKRNRLELAELVGDSLPLTFDFSTLLFERRPVLSVDSLWSRSAERPEFRAMESELLLSDLEVEKSVLERRPNLLLQGRYMAMRGEEEWAVGASVALPFVPWASNENRAKKRAAERGRRAVEIRKERLLFVARQQLEQGYLEWELAVRERELLEQQELEWTQELFRAVAREAAANRADWSEIYAAEQHLWRTEQLLLRAVEREWLALISLEERAALPLKTFWYTTSHQGENDDDN